MTNSNASNGGASDTSEKRANAIATALALKITEAVTAFKKDETTAPFFRQNGQDGAPLEPNDVVNKLFDALTQSGFDPKTISDLLTSKVKEKETTQASSSSSGDEETEGFDSPLHSRSTNVPSGAVGEQQPEKKSDPALRFGTAPPLISFTPTGQDRSKEGTMGTMARARETKRAQARIAQEYLERVAKEKEDVSASPTKDKPTEQGGSTRMPPPTAATTVGGPPGDEGGDPSSSSSSEDEDDWETSKGSRRFFPKPGTVIPGVVVRDFKSPFKLELTKKYSASDDSPISLDRWYMSLRTQCRLARIHEASMYATTLAIGCVEGKPSHWMTREVQRDLDLYLPEDDTDLREIASPWPLGRIRDELYSRFVNKDDHLKAEAEWERLSQIKRNGSFFSVSELDTALNEIAERMNEATQMQRKKRLMKALRPEIAMHLYREPRLRGWDRKKSIRYADLVSEARNIEQALKIVEDAASSASTPSKNRPSQGERTSPRSNNRQPRGQQQNGSSSKEQAERPRRSKEEQELFEKRKEENACYECGSKEHKVRDCPSRPKSRKTVKELAADPDLEGGGPFPRELLVKVGLQGQEGFDALLDTGASHSIMKHSLPMLIGAHVKSYSKPQRINLAAKGSHVTAYKYVETLLSIGGVTRRWRFILLNIAEDVIIGRDFCRYNKVKVSFNPDRIEVSEEKPSPPSPREPKRRFASTTTPVKTFKGFVRTDKPSPFDEATNPPPHPDPKEPPPAPLKPYHRFTFVSRIPHEDLGHVPGWQAPKEVVSEFFTELKKFYKLRGVIRTKDDILPQPPHRGALDHDVPYYDETEDVDPQTAYSWAKAVADAMFDMVQDYRKGGQFDRTHKPAKAPMIAKIKKNKRGRPVGDWRKRNKLTRAMPMQPVDADAMINDVAKALYRLGNDFMKAFEQLCATIAAQNKNILATPIGNFIVRTAGQGDKNSAFTLQRMLFYIFEGMNGKNLKIYADDSWIVSDCWNDFKELVCEFFARCEQWSLIISEESMQCCPEVCDVLGREIRGNLIYKSPKAVDPLVNYVKPTKAKGVRRFLGAVNFQARFAKNLASLAAPLYELTTQEGDVKWSKTHDLSFDRVRQLMAEDIALHPLDEKKLAAEGHWPIHHSSPPEKTPKNMHPGEHLFLFSDASNVGASGVLAVGTHWWHSRILGYWSHKWDTTESRWSTYKQELAAPVNALRHWSTTVKHLDVTIITDNKSVSSLLSQDDLNEDQHKALDALSPFSFDIQWIEGEHNVAADAFSRQYEDGEPEQEEPAALFRYEETDKLPTRSLSAMERPSRSRRAPAHLDDYVATPRRQRVPADSLFEDLIDFSDNEGASPSEETASLPPLQPIDPDGQLLAHASDSNDEPERPLRRQDPQDSFFSWGEEQQQEQVALSASQRRRLRRNKKVAHNRKEEAWEQPATEDTFLFPSWQKDFENARFEAYSSDSTFRKVLEDLSSFSEFFLEGKELYFKDEEYGDRLCIPSGTFSTRNNPPRSFREIYLEHFHTVLGHTSYRIMLHTMKQHVYWPTLSREITSYCSSCPSCQATKYERASPRGKLHSIRPPGRAYEQISMDFTGPHVESKDADGNVRDYIWTVIDNASGEVKLIPTNKAGLTAEKCASLFLEHVYKDWGIPKRILSDQDVRWTSAFWRSFHRSLGTTLAMSTAYHPQSNGKIEHLHSVLNPMLRNLVNEQQNDWALLLPHVALAINSARNASGFSPYQLTRVFQPNLALSAAKRSENDGAEKALKLAKLRNEIAKDLLARARVETTYFANKHRRPDHIPSSTAEKQKPGEQPQGYWVRTKNWKTVSDRTRSIVPPYAGPFVCLAHDASNSTYKLALPARYTSRGIGSTFHASQLKPYVPSDDSLFPNRLVDSVPLFPIDAIEQMTNSRFALDEVERYLDWVNDETNGDITLAYLTTTKEHRYVLGGVQGHDEHFAKLQEFVLAQTHGKSSDFHDLPVKYHKGKQHKPKPPKSSPKRQRRNDDEDEQDSPSSSSRSGKIHGVPLLHVDKHVLEYISAVYKRGTIVLYGYSDDKIHIEPRAPGRQALLGGSYPRLEGRNEPFNSQYAYDAPPTPARQVPPPPQPWNGQRSGSPAHSAVGSLARGMEGLDTASQA